MHRTIAKALIKRPKTLKSNLINLIKNVCLPIGKTCKDLKTIYLSPRVKIMDDSNKQILILIGKNNLMLSVVYCVCNSVYKQNINIYISVLTIFDTYNY